MIKEIIAGSLITISNLVGVQVNEINSIKDMEVTYNNKNVRESSNLTKESLEAILNKSPGNLGSLSESFIEAEEKYNINALFLASIVILESNWGRSSRAINSNNLTGMAVYGDKSAGYKYKSKKDCILDLARQLDKFYLTKDGIYFNGYSSQAVNISYCEKKDWHVKIDKISNQLIGECLK